MPGDELQTPEDNVELEVIARNGMATNEKLDDLNAATEAGAIAAREAAEEASLGNELAAENKKSTDAVKESVDAMQPSLEATAKATQLMASFIETLRGPAPSEEQIMEAVRKVNAENNESRTEQPAN